MRLIAPILLIATIILAAGCTTLADSIASKGSGHFRLYEHPKSDVWPVTIQAIDSVGLELVAEIESSSMILAQRGISAFSHGENVAVFVEDVDGEKCRVEVVSKNAIKTNLFAPDWSGPIFEYLDASLQ